MVNLLRLLYAYAAILHNTGVLLMSFNRFSAMFFPLVCNKVNASKQKYLSDLATKKFVDNFDSCTGRPSFDCSSICWGKMTYDTTKERLIIDHDFVSLQYLIDNRWEAQVVVRNVSFTTYYSVAVSGILNFAVLIRLKLRKKVFYPSSVHFEECQQRC